MGWDLQDQFFPALLMVCLSPSHHFPITMGRHRAAAPRGADSHGLNRLTQLTPTQQKLRENNKHPFVSPARSRLGVYLVIQPNTSWFISLGHSTLGKQRMKWQLLMKGRHSAATYRPQLVCVGQEMPFFFFFLVRDFSLKFSSQCSTDCNGVIPELFNINERRIRCTVSKTLP